MRGTWFLSFKLCSSLFRGRCSAGPLAEDEAVVRCAFGEALHEVAVRAQRHRAAARWLDRHLPGARCAAPDDHAAAGLLDVDREAVGVERGLRLAVRERQAALEGPDRLLVHV